MRFNRLCAALLLLMTGTPLLAQDKILQPQTEIPPLSKEARPLTGIVKPLRAVQKERGIQPEKEVSPETLVLVNDKGELLTLIEDAGSRLFFNDSEMQGRPVRLMAVVVPGTRSLKVERVQTVVEGKLFDVDYWCERCQLKYSEPGICVCCNQPAVRRELPAAENEPEPTPAVVDKL